MPKCPECSGEISAGSPSCAACGALVDSSLVPTRLRPDGPARAGEAGKGTGEVRGSAGLRGSSGASRSAASTDTIDDARFAPGFVLAGRYRVVGLLGRGGMGEVYRADDLTLKQPVALKLLPEALSNDAEALERFRREVRVARQISHPNVCRVYDIGESEGLHFLSMEFIRGEELASVLKRFGRLPVEKAAEIARQVCAGVAAAPQQGILRPPVAVACLAASVLLLALAVALSGRAEMPNVMPLEKSPEVLAERAREIAARLGYTERPVDTAEGFFWYDQILSYVKEHDSSRGRWTL